MLKRIKSILAVVLLVMIAASNISSAQDDLDKQPFPVGGIKAIMKNVVYPESAVKEGIEGKVIVKAVVSEKGEVISTEVIKSAGKALDDAAEAAIMKTKFTPGEKDGKKVKAEVTIPVMFKLS
ncbi:MAG: energy transducer TonB [Melioribacteraceae bacterium]|nr:energy transducer TonB [Melioribacteraceae bacterium]MCF8354741.1 energy transducer TonB [Melioribacteraceae bacterium]MCF8393237.1 energy transducer TonB [Melioribacteraceae bacterium]MCF8417538.1 energy transducer TonB [Melioribacteraceae bacterium]